VLDIAIRQLKGASPLRYPGGKSAMTDFLALTISGLELHEATYVEPYAGGAGAALALLDRGDVSRIVINDLDPAIFAFWDSIVNNTDAFLRMVKETSVTLAEWDRQKSIYKAGIGVGVLALGFATFFLNRTNRSGVLNAGVIGGRSQAGTYKIDARYNKTRLMSRIQEIGEKRGSIEVTNRDGLQVISEHVGDSDSFIYADPPYFDKGSFLYLNAFAEKDHEALANVLNSNPNGNWLLSYDNAPEIVALYPRRFQATFSLNYSAHRNGKAHELLICSDAVRQRLRSSLDG
jgi:DNA adenine methylase